MLHVWGDVAEGVGDDAAVLDVPSGEQLVVSTDTSVENVHFRAEWISAAEIGYRATTAALSDLAAMAATPLGVVVALTVPPAWRSQLTQVAEGIGEAVRVAGTLVRGGDLSAGSEFSLAITVFGSAKSPLRRSSIRPGDHLYVTGALSGPGRAVRAWQTGETPSAWCRERFAKPRARLKEAVWLVQKGAHAAIDISDGLSSELMHLARASSVELRVDVERVPAGGGGSWRDAMQSGEEYELVVASPAPLDTDLFVRTFGVPLTRIGEARGAAEGAVTLRETGGLVEIAAGHDHFNA